MKEVWNVISWLNQAGIRACEAQNSQQLPDITSPIAAVGMKEGAVPGGLCLQATVLCHHSLGGILCTETAMTAAEALSRHGATCHVGPVTFDGDSGLFSVAVTGEFPAFLPVKVGVVELGHVTDFSATWLQKDELWHYRLEERFSLEEAEEVKPAAPFSIICRSDAYHNCTVTETVRTLDAGGLTQVTQGTATKMTSV